MKVKIAVCNRRTDKKYKNQEMDWQYISDRNKNPVRTSETAEEYPKLPKEQRANLKDIGGLVGGDVDPDNLSAMPRLFTTTTLFLGGAALILLILSVPIARMMREGHPDSPPEDPIAEVPDTLPEEK